MQRIITSYNGWYTTALSSAITNHGQVFFILFLNNRIIFSLKKQKKRKIIKNEEEQIHVWSHNMYVVCANQAQKKNTTSSKWTTNVCARSLLPPHA